MEKDFLANLIHGELTRHGVKCIQMKKENPARYPTLQFKILEKHYSLVLQNKSIVLLDGWISFSEKAMIMFSTKSFQALKEKLHGLGLAHLESKD